MRGYPGTDHLEGKNETDHINGIAAPADQKKKGKRTDRTKGKDPENVHSPADEKSVKQTTRSVRHGKIMFQKRAYLSELIVTRHDRLSVRIYIEIRLSKSENGVNKNRNQKVSVIFFKKFRDRFFCVFRT